MFFIPIAAVILFVWFIFYLIGAYNQGKSRHRAVAYQDALEKTRMYMDQDLENDLRYHFEKHDMRPGDVVCSFMGGDRQWKVYADSFSSDSINKAILAMMAKQGKVPWRFFASGCGLHLPESITHTPGPNQIRPERMFVMNEEFILRAEECLNRNGAPVSAYCTVDLPDGRKNVFISVRSLRQEYGAGLTRYFTNFQFLDSSYGGNH